MDENVTVENNSTGVDEQVEQTQSSNTDTQTEKGMTTLLGATETKVEPQAEGIAYNFKDSVPEGFEFSQEQSDKFVDVIKDMGLSNEQANAIAKYGFDWAQGIAQQVQDSFHGQFQATADKWGEETKEAYGAGLNTALANAGSAIEYLERNGVPNIRQMFGVTGAGSRVEMVQLLNVVSKLIESDPGKGLTASANGFNGLDKFYDKTDFDKL